MPRIVFKGRIDNYTGWGQQLCHLIQFCIGAGYEVIVLAETVSEPFTSVIPPAVKERIVKGVVGGGCFWKATHLEGNASGDRGMIYSTVWESDKVSPQATRCINMAKCLVVPSQFCAEAAPRSGITIPVRVVPHGLDKSIYRYHPPIGPETCVFGSAGRLAHGPRRKGLEAVIEAFLEAFPSEEDVFLKLKTFSDCKLTIPEDRRIEVTTRYLTEPDVAKWLASLTCFVSAARGEGWGLWQHQALSVGRPLICAQYGGPDMFVTERNSFIVDHQIVPAEEGRYAGNWCEPSHASMVEQMRNVYEARNEAASRGRVGSLETGDLTIERAALKAVKVMEEFGFETKELMASTQDLRIKMHGATSVPRAKPVKTVAQRTEPVTQNTGRVWAQGIPSEVVFRGRLDLWTGYGQQFCPIIDYFVKSGYNVKIRATEVSEPDGLPVPPILKDRVVKDIPQASPWEWQMLPLGGHKVTPGKKVIYFTMWEADGITPEMVQTLNQCACVVVPCKWNADSFRNCGVTVPIRIVPLGIDCQMFEYQPPRPSALCVFGAAGRPGHGRVRKGLDQIIEAFRISFQKEKDVRLHIKVYGDDPISEITDSRIKINTSFLSEKECAAWLSDITAFAGFWRGEGWGLWQQKSMAVGRPVIGPLYSGPTEFMTEENSYSLVFGEEPATETQSGSGRWCCPDLGSLIERMRQVYHNRKEAESKGISASMSASRFTLKRTAVGVLEVMTEFGMLSGSDQPTRIRVASPEVVTLSDEMFIRCPVDHTGYGTFGTLLVKALVARGTKIVFSPTRIDPECNVPEGTIHASKRDTHPKIRIALDTPCAPQELGNSIAYTMWESTRLPYGSIEMLNRCRLIIVPNQWNASCMSAQGIIRPVRIVPLGIDTGSFAARPLPSITPFVIGTAGRTEYGGIRKGFDIVTEAFLRAFPDDPDVRLRIKSMSPAIQQHADKRVSVERRRLTATELADWYGQLHVFASGSACEGWGLHQQEAMAVGRPVIGVAFGGVTEFWNSSNGYPVEFELAQGAGPYVNCGHYAKPDVDSMAEQMILARTNSKLLEEKSYLSTRASRFSIQNSANVLLSVLSKEGLWP